jgi:hypothetical protein
MSTNHNYFKSYFHSQSFPDITSTMSKTKKNIELVGEYDNYYAIFEH